MNRGAENALVGLNWRTIQRCAGPNDGLGVASSGLVRSWGYEVARKWWCARATAYGAGDPVGAADCPETLGAAEPAGAAPTPSESAATSM